MRYDLAIVGSGAAAFAAAITAREVGASVVMVERSRIGEREPARDRLAGRSPAHGFGDDEETRRLLRSRPPRQALAWAGARLGGRVISARALFGGTSSAVHALTTQDSTGRRRQAVLRRYVRPELNAEDPGIAAREARALHVAGAVGVPTPALLAVDPDGTQAGVPSVLMSRLPGRVDWWPSEVGRWLRRLAEILPVIHAAPLPPAGQIGLFAPDLPESFRPPSWARYPRIWERAADISQGAAPVLPQVLVHRDFHPGNVLWRRGMVCGVVDWQAVCAGPAVADVAHCRVNLLTLGTSAAEEFTAWWQQVSGTAYHPWADVIAIFGFLDDLREDWGCEQFAVEDMLGRAVAELGGSSRLPDASLTPDGHSEAESSAASCWRSMPRAWSRTGLGRPGTKPSGASCLRLRRLSCARRSGAADPFAGAVGEPLVLPDGHRGLELIDQRPAGVQCLGAVRAGHRHDHRQVADLQVADAMHGSDPGHLELLGDNSGDAAEFIDRGRVRAVGKPGDLPVMIAVPDRSGEQGDAARGGVRDRGPNLVHRQLSHTNVYQSHHGHQLRIPVGPCEATYKSTGLRVSSRPCCMANSVAVERVEAPVLA
jgi:aminoglycoside phosphotransferase (APT) family kinase protein